MAEEIIFADGMSFQKPDELKFKVPEFVKGKVSIKVDKFIAFLEANKNGEWVNLDLLESKKGSWYFKLNTWKPSKKQEGETQEGEMPGDEVF